MSHKYKIDYCHILENAPIGVLIADTDGKILDVNQKLVEIMGAPSREDTLKINLFTFSNLIKSGISDDIKNVIKTAKPLIVDRRYHSKWGKNMWLRLHMNVIKDRKKIAGVECFIEDVTKNHNLRTQLMKSKNYYDEFATNIPIGLYRISKAGKVMYANKYCMNLLGVDSLSKLKRMYLIDDGLTKNYPREEFEDKIERLGQISDFEARWFDQNGREVWTTENAKMLKSGTGKIYYEGTIRDITNRKLMELALKESESKYEKLIDNISIGIYRTTPSGDILVFNPYMLSIFGFKNISEARKFNLESEDFHLMYNRDRFKKILDEQGEIRDLESQLSSVNNRKIWIRESSIAVKNKDGSVRYYEGVVQDITKRKMAEDKLFDSYKHLGTLNRQIGILADLNKYKDISNARQVYSMIMKYAMTLSNSNACFIFKYEEKEDIFSLTDWDSDFNEVLGCSKNKKYYSNDFDCFLSLVGSISIQKRDFSENDMINFDIVNKNNYEYMVHIPLIIHNNLLGSILLCSSKKHNLMSQEMDVLEIFGVQATFLLMNLFAFSEK